MVRPVGEFDLAGVEAVEEALRPLEHAFSTVLVDLREVEFLDSTGLRTLLQADARSRRNGFELQIINSDSGQVRRVLELTGMDKKLPLIDISDPRH